MTTGSGHKAAPAFFRDGGKGGEGFPKLCPTLGDFVNTDRIAKLI